MQAEGCCVLGSLSRYTKSRLEVSMMERLCHDLFRGTLLNEFHPEGGVHIGKTLAAGLSGCRNPHACKLSTIGEGVSRSYNARHGNKPGMMFSIRSKGYGRLPPANIQQRRSYILTLIPQSVKPLNVIPAPILFAPLEAFAQKCAPTMAFVASDCSQH